MRQTQGVLLLALLVFAPAAAGASEGGSLGPSVGLSLAQALPFVRGRTIGGNLSVQAWPALFSPDLDAANFGSAWVLSIGILTST